ncbi:MAG: hypothetical protein K2L78_01085 [Muribaculaceae bacterium]|nr:hypothetical protein [Muribaculaceae bacterium]
MSKQKLTKEIRLLERHQLEQMILDAYCARKEIKEFFDFFLNPDVEKLIEKYKVAVSKEFSRSKRGHSKARISVIKKLLKEFQGFQPGYDKEIELMHYIINFALLSEASVYFSETLMKGISSIMMKMVETADRNLVADTLLASLTALLDNEASGTRYFRRFLRDELSAYRP